MKNVGVFVDVCNIHQNVIRKYGQGKLDYKKYLQRAVGQDSLYRATAYGIYLKEEDTKFIDCLKRYGFETKFKIPPVRSDKIIGWVNWNINITLDIVKLISKLDVLVIGSSNRELIPTIEYARELGIYTVVFSTFVNHDLKSVSNKWIEVNKELIKNDSTNPTE